LTGTCEDRDVATRLKPQQGFSLIEVMVAFGILAIGMAGVAAMLLTSMQSDQYSIEMRDGDVVAMRQIEYLKSQAADTAISSGVSSYLGYYYQWSLTTGTGIGTDLPTGINQLAITVGWGGSKIDGCTCNALDILCCRFTSKIVNFIFRSGS